MSVAAPSRRLAGRCLFCQTLPIRPRVPHQQQKRTAVFGSGSKTSGDGNDSGQAAPKRPNPVLEEFQRRQAAEGNEPAPAATQQLQPQAGDLSAASIFEDDRRIQHELGGRAAAPDHDSQLRIGGKIRDPQNMRRTLDPDPNARERWERKKVIQIVRKGGRLSRPQLIKRTEREHVVKSHNFKTSVKKLGMLARQIAGKTIDDAIVQMRFSKKKVAQEIRKQLEYARDEAVVMRGMGLGKAAAETDKKAPTAVPGTPADTSAVEIQLKDGKRHTVADRSTIYIDQAWVGRGPFGQLPDYRARGQINIMRTPWTHLTVVLKEEATRIREHAEREDKRRRQMLGHVWTHLPDRPVQWQRQWYTF